MREQNVALRHLHIRQRHQAALIRCESVQGPPWREDIRNQSFPPFLEIHFAAPGRHPPSHKDRRARVGSQTHAHGKRKRHAIKRRCPGFTNNHRPWHHGSRNYIRCLSAWNRHQCVYRHSRVITTRKKAADHIWREFRISQRHRSRIPAAELLEVNNDLLHGEICVVFGVLTVHDSSEPVQTRPATCRTTLRIYERCLAFVRPRNHCSLLLELLLQHRRPARSDGGHP